MFVIWVKMLMGVTILLAAIRLPWQWQLWDSTVLCVVGWSNQ